MRSQLATVAVGSLSAELAVESLSAAFVEKNPLRDADLDETHVHTSWSFHAFILGKRLTGPADADKYAKGERVTAYGSR